MTTRTDAELLEDWDEMKRRLIWQYGAEIGQARYERLADGTSCDLIRWRSIGGLTADE